jgi:hemerythrin superfamily protein
MKATEVIKRDHKAVEDLFETYKKANQDAREAMEKKIFDALTVHEKMEDEYFYSALDEAIKDDEEISALEAEQTQLKVGVTALRLVPFMDRTDSVKTTLEKVIEHAKKEENIIFPKAEEALGAEQLEKIGEKMEPESAVASQE